VAQVFVSYAGEDAARANRLIASLKAQNIDTFGYMQNMPVGGTLSDERAAPRPQAVLQMVPHWQARLSPTAIRVTNSHEHGRGSMTSMRAAPMRAAATKSPIPPAPGRLLCHRSPRLRQGGAAPRG
jgi:hypothetical protein